MQSMQQPKITSTTNPIPEFEPLSYNNIGVTRDAEAKIKLIKDEFKQVGSHKFLRMGVIQLTASEHSQLKSCFETTDSFITFVNQNA